MSHNNNGVYFSFLVSENDAIKLNEFGREKLGLDMENSGCSYETRKHASLFASKTRNEVDYEQIVKEREDTTITVKPVGWKIIKSPNTGDDCLALIINSDELVKHHEEIKKITGLNHAFDDFITHISIHYDVKISKAELKDLPIPDFDIKLDRLFTKVYENQYTSESTKPGEKQEPNNDESQIISSDIKNINNRMKVMRERALGGHTYKQPKLK